jgi:hypothetical protein
MNSANKNKIIEKKDDNNKTIIPADIAKTLRLL